VKIRVLGSAAGGGFPQWNCNCRNCSGVRNGTLPARPRTQSSIAVSGDDARRWALVNVSPDILEQLKAQRQLQPARAARDTGIEAIVLVDGQIDHTAGLLMLRESSRPLRIWCTDRVHADLTRGNPILAVLRHYCGVERRVMSAGAEFGIEGIGGVRWQALTVAGKPAPYSPGRDSPAPGDNVALVIGHGESGRSVVYAPGLAAIDEVLWRAMQAAACVLVDGTFWSDEEMRQLGFARQRARELGHLPQSGPGGMLEWLDQLPSGTRRILIHVNNTNPILDESSPERAELTRRGVEVAEDGLEIVL
jgi:pyrroloquinoline quinone biosynthesis protein B